MDLIVDGAGFARFGDHVVHCVLGRGGRSHDKREGDGATPIGRWRLRALLYRADRLAMPVTGLDCRAIGPADGWCDDPADARYNLPVRLPYAGRTESLWRADHVYDLIVPLGYNDDPVVPGLGSAIFLHCARHDFAPTEGCIALGQEDLLRYLALAGPGSMVVVEP